MNSDRILIIRGGGIGDFILTLPAIYALRKCYSNSYIEVMTHLRFFKLVENKFYANSAYSIDQAAISQFFLQGGNVSIMKDYFKSFDLILSYLPDKEGIFQENLERVNKKKIIFHASFPDTQTKQHIIDYLLIPVKNLGIKIDINRPQIFLKDEHKDWANSFFADNKLVDKVLAVHPGSGSLKKCWDVQNFANVINWWMDKHGKVLIICGEADEQIIGECKNLLLDEKFVIAKHIELVNLASLIARCNWYIGNDSGITHLAAAVGIKTVALFSKTDPNIWGPRGENAKIVKTDNLSLDKIKDILNI
ncbi:glycosyltransferase family 9 protein [bacterium]|nr:glycosyltransferase family 9 protein [bacterium]